MLPNIIHLLIIIVTPSVTTCSITILVIFLNIIINLLAYMASTMNMTNIAMKTISYFINNVMIRLPCVISVEVYDMHHVG